MSRAVIALGANLGDRLATLRDAVRALADLGVVTAVSDVYETDPVGGPEQPAYLNAVVVLETELAPHDLLTGLQRIEAEHGRTRDVRWGARTLDLDILEMDGRLLADPDLELPHPRAHERGFVLIPWHDVDPQAVIPGQGSVRDLLGVVGTEGVRRHADALVVAP